MKHKYSKPILSLLIILLHSSNYVNAQYSAPSSAEIGSAIFNENTVVGNNAGNNLMTGNYNSLYGEEAGKDLIDGRSNCMFGHDAGANTNTGSFNSFFGSSVGALNTTGDRNSFFGYRSGVSNTIGRFNSFYGDNSGVGNTTGSENSCFGHKSGEKLNDGDHNALFGAQSGREITSGLRNTMIGTLAGAFLETGSNNVCVGHLATPLGNSTGNIQMGLFTGKELMGNYNVLIGNEAGRAIQGDRNIFIGNKSGPVSTYSNPAILSDRLFIDIQNSSTPLIYGEFDTDFVKINGNFEVLDRLKFESNNTFIGSSAGLLNTTGSYNTFAGANSGTFNTTGEENSFFGESSGANISSGSYNTFFGSWSGSNNSSGSNNTFYGFNSGSQILGSSNICLGSNTGPTSGNGDLNNRLFINNEQSDTPLIYGEFDNDFIKINGTFEVTAGLSNPSDVNLKNNFEEVDASDILNKIDNLPITKWTYKDRQSETHIGATAQDFHKAFGLGTDDKRISTIDADGVALAAIKALKKENDEQAFIIQELIKRIEKIENK